MENSREEDIEELKRLLYRDELTQYGKRKLINYYEQQEKDYKRVLKENEQLRTEVNSLKKENEELKNQEATARRINELLVQRYSNSIPVQKVKDKIEELNKKEKKELKGMKGQDRYFVKQTYQNKRMILQELIEEREEK